LDQSIGQPSSDVGGVASSRRVGFVLLTRPLLTRGPSHPRSMRSDRGRQAPHNDAVTSNAAGRSNSPCCEAAGPGPFLGEIARHDVGPMMCTRNAGPPVRLVQPPTKAPRQNELRRSWLAVRSVSPDVTLWTKFKTATRAGVRHLPTVRIFPVVSVEPLRELALQ
jgi:hypothetical protein